MAFNQATFAPIGAQSADTPKLFAYKTTDDINTVTAANYFNDKRFQFSAGDIIMASISGSLSIINVTSASASGVTTSITESPVKELLINSKSDFPDPVAGDITLEAETLYRLGNDIDLGTDRLILSEDTVVSGVESLVITLTYTGTGDMFTGVNVVNRISNLTIDCPNGRILNWSTNVFKLFRMNDVTIKACDKIALMNSVGGAAVCRFTNVSPAEVTTDGIELTGDWNTFFHEVSSGTLSGGAYFNLGTATFDAFIVDLPLVSLAAGTNLISGASGSANINSGGIGLVTRALTSGAGTPLDGVSVEDALWSFKDNDDIADTRPDGLLSLQGNATATVIAVAGTPVLVAGTWVVERASQFTGTTAGRLTYNGGKAATLPVIGSFTVEPVSGGAVNVSIEVAIDGSVVANSKRTSNTSAGNPASITIPWQEVFSTASFIEFFVTNEDTTVNVLVSSGTGRVN